MFKKYCLHSMLILGALLLTVGSDWGYAEDAPVNNPPAPATPASAIPANFEFEKLVTLWGVYRNAADIEAMSTLYPAVDADLVKRENKGVSKSNSSQVKLIVVKQLTPNGFALEVERSWKGAQPGKMKHVLYAQLIQGALYLRATEKSLSEPALNKIAQTAAAQGVKNCLGRINQVTNYVGYTDNLGALLMVPPNQPNDTLIPIVMEIPLSNGSALVSSEFAPNQANGCGASYEALVYWPEKCDVVGESKFSSYKNMRILEKNIKFLSDGLYNKVFLITVGGGCISMKKELVK